MALVLRIVDANGIARTVQAKPGERIVVRPGDTITVVEGAGVRAERSGNELVIIYAEGQVVLDGFFPGELPPGLAPLAGAALAPGADAPPADSLATLIFENSDGLNIVTPAGTELRAGSSLLGDSGGQPENFALPENSPRASSSFGSTGGNAGQPGNQPPAQREPEPDSNPPESGGTGIPNFNFEVVSVESREGGVLVFTIARDGGTQAASVTVTTSDGTATSGEDFGGYTGVVSFGSGVMTQTITIVSITDHILEVTENFRITLSNPSNGATLGPASNGDGLLQDPSFTISAGTAGENGAVVFTVTREGDAPGPQTVEFATFDRSATTTGGAGQGQFDYTPTSGTLTFSQGETSRTVTVDITNDSLFDHTVAEPFGAVLTNAAAT